MLALALIWGATGLVVGGLGLVAGARLSYRTLGGRWGRLARGVMLVVAIAAATIVGAAFIQLLAGRLAATAAAPGVAAVAALLALNAPWLARRWRERANSAPAP